MMLLVGNIFIKWCCNFAYTKMRLFSLQVIHTYCSRFFLDIETKMYNRIRPWRISNHERNQIPAHRDYTF